MKGLRTGLVIPLWCGILVLLFTHPTQSQDNRSNVSLFLNQSESLMDPYVSLENSTLAEGSLMEEDVVNYNIIAPSYEDHLEKSSIIYGLVKVANASNVNPSCHRHLSNIRKGILRKEPWAMKG